MLGRVVALAALGGFLFGYDLGLIGGAVLGISDAFHISNATKEAIVGAAKLGAFFGTFIGGVCMLRYGRRKAISLQAAFFVAGPALMAAAPGPAALIAGRLLVGLGIGASAIVVPAYLAEIAPAKNRGMVVQMYEVMLTLGMLAAVLVNLGLSAAAGGAAWRWMVGLPAIPGAFLLASLVSLPESPRWLVMRGQLDAALATLHTIIASSSSGSRGKRGSRARSRQAAMQQVRAAADAAAGLQHEAGVAGGAAVAEDAAWLNAAPEAGRPRNAEQQALEAAEDELLLLWSSVQKEQAAGLELRQAAVTSAGGRTAAGNGTAATADGQVVVSTTPTAAAPAAAAAGCGSSSPRRRFAVQAAPAAAFSLDGEEGHDHNPVQQYQQQKQHGLQDVQQQQRQQQQVQDAYNSSDAAPELDGHLTQGHKGGAAALKALQQKLHLPGKGGVAGGAEGDTEGQQQLLGPGAVSSSSSNHHIHQQSAHHHHQQQHHHQQHHHHQQQQHVDNSLPYQQQHKRLVELGQESNVFASLWAMLCDISAVAKGPESAAFAIACCLAVFDQATASTAIINYAPEVLANRMGVEDPNLAIMYPAAIALAKVVGTLIAAGTVDKYGRKPLLFWGGVGCAVFLGLTGAALWTSSVALFLAALCLFIFSFSMSWAGLYWVVVSEIFSMGAKSPATSAATSLLFLTGACVNFVYLSLIHWIGGFAFVLFGLISAGSAWYVWARVPETKGRTLAEIQALLAPSAANAGAAGTGRSSAAGSPTNGHQGFREAGPGRALGSGQFAGFGTGSPLLPVVQQNGVGSEQGGGDSRLVELRQLMSKDTAQL